MKTIIPYVGELDSRVTDAAPEATPIELVSEAGYFELLSRMWRRGESFINIEHDIVVWPETLTQLAECPFDWCVSTYASADWGSQAPKLGCAKFSAKLLAEHPDIMQQVGTIENDGVPARHWAHLDYRLSKVLWLNGVREHQHAPPEYRMVEHISPYAHNKHRCVNGAECWCELGVDGHGCPISFPGRPSVIVHYCHANELPWHLGVLSNLKGETIPNPKEERTYA